MKCLLDSHALLWFLLDDRRLSTKARELLLDVNNEFVVSTVSFWELSLKSSLGKLSLSGINLDEIEQVLHNQRIGIIGLSAQESLSFHHLPPVPGHRDPFDRMLIWQAIRHSIALLSGDSHFKTYESFGLNLVW